MAHRVLIVLVASTCLLAQTLAICDVCQTDEGTRVDYACVSRTAYKYCSSNGQGLVVDDDSIESCEPGEVCSDGHWCRPEGEAEAGCDRTETVPTCPQCSDSVTFVCTSRTTFQKCNGIDIDEQVYNCPANKVCDMASGKFCIDMCGQVGALECNIPAPTT